jgi:hypothetical protein
MPSTKRIPRWRLAAVSGAADGFDVASWRQAPLAGRERGDDPRSAPCAASRQQGASEPVALAVGAKLAQTGLDVVVDEGVGFHGAASRGAESGDLLIDDGRC